MKYPIGLSFMNAQGEKLTVIGYYEVKGSLMYHFDNSELMTDENIDFYLSKQERWTELQRQRKIRDAEERAQMEQDTLNLKIKRTHIDEYLNQFTGVKRAKIDTTLSKEELYSSGLYARYKWIEKGVSEGKRVEIKTFSNMFSKRAKNDYKTEICMFSDESTFTVITKTEHDYFNWLIANK